MELEIVKSLNNFGGEYVNLFTSFISSETFLITLWTTITFFIIFSNKREGKRIFLAVFVSLTLHFFISELLIKQSLSSFFFRTRPYLVDPSIIPIGKQYADSSFPSSHMASTFAVLSVYYHYYNKYLFPIIFFAISMAFARIHNGMHHPTDVLAGTIFGIIYAAVSIYLVNKFYTQKKQ